MASSAQLAGVQRQELQSAIAKAIELRALHAALLQGSSGSSPLIRLPQAGASPSISRVPNQFTAEDYPVFTPSYEESLLRNNSICPENRSLSETWSGIGLDREREHETVTQDEESTSIEYENLNNLSSSNSEPPNLFSASIEHHLLKRVRCTNHLLTPLSLSAPEFVPKAASCRTSSGDLKAVTTCNTCKPATINKADLTEPMSVQAPIKKPHKTQILSWLFHKTNKKKSKARSASSPNTVAGSENMSHLLNEWGVISLESLKKELVEANQGRDTALAEVADMRGSLGELTNKLFSLEAYCEELKKALKQAVNAKNVQAVDRSNLSKRTKSISIARDNNYLPVSHEVMVEGFLQVVSEARLSVKQLCKALINQTGESDGYGLLERLNSLLQPYQVIIGNSNCVSKSMLYHLEAVLNQSLYQDFENCSYCKNGCPKFLDPKKECHDKFSSFVALRNLSWNEVLQKGTKYYSEDFSRFCDQKMSCIVSCLGWSKPWPEQLLQCFFVAAKCIWLLHLLAFSFSPPLAILRVEEDRGFDPVYMEEIVLERQRGQIPGRVKVMVMPGFYVQDRVLKCRVLCMYR
ncbi:IRK-interacting protein [Carex littledalei]|uniref:IRK-interacting protein n=1 Tax=Carex littledalei TaxID=544730 RepID=A0A833UXL4_9POAL|nr:IRK-interacting protein [Carex littledalei]